MYAKLIYSDSGAYLVALDGVVRWVSPSGILLGMPPVPAAARSDHEAEGSIQHHIPQIHLDHIEVGRLYL